MNSFLMSQAEFAAHRGVQKSAVSNWKKKGLIVFSEDPAQPGRLFVNVAQTEARLSSRVDPTRGRPRTSDAASASPPAAEPGSLPLDGGGERKLADIRLDLLEEQRIGQRMKNMREAEELAPRQVMEQRLVEAVRAIFSRMASMHRGLAERLASATEPRAIVAILEEATDRMRTNLANRIDAGSDADDEPADEEGGDLSAEAEDGPA